jgi:Tfp pilus assembly protein PilN
MRENMRRNFSKKEYAVIDERETEKSLFPLLMGGAATLMMGIVITATLFISPAPQAAERSAASTLAHGQHHIFSLR